MTRANYGLRLNRKQIDGDRVCCTGNQLVLILDAIKLNITEYLWFVNDIDAFGLQVPAAIFQTKQPVYAGNTEELISIVAKVDQFLYGVFVASKNPAFSEIVYTEDGEFPEIDDLFLRIHTFDTSYFEIWGDLDTIQILALKFGSNILYRTPEEGKMSPGEIE